MELRLNSLFGGKSEELRRQLSELERRNSELNEDRETVNQIIDEMNQGLVLLSTRKKILSVNRCAACWLNGCEDDLAGLELISFVSDPLVLGAVNDALHGQRSTVLWQREGIILRCFANPATAGERVTGVILMLVDVTALHRQTHLRENYIENAAACLQTPLASIAARADQLRRLRSENGDTSQQDTLLAEIADEAARASSLSVELLLLSRLDAGLEDGKRVKVNLYTLARSILLSLEQQATRQGLKIMVDGENATLFGNLLLLQEMIRQVLDNSLRCTPSGGSISVEVGEKEGVILLRISDTGCGIPAEHLPHVAERFFQGPKAGKRGYGLGLSIAEEISRLNGGCMTVESPEGQGTRVTFCFPNTTA